MCTLSLVYKTLVLSTNDLVIFWFKFNVKLFLSCSSNPGTIKSDVVFGGAQLPDGNSGGFGTAKYKSENYDMSENRLLIEVNAVFGGVQIHQY